MGNNILNGLQLEIDRCSELLKVYESINAGEYGAAVIRRSLDRAKKALVSGDVLQCIEAYTELETVQWGVIMNKKYIVIKAFKWKIDGIDTRIKKDTILTKYEDNDGPIVYGFIDKYGNEKLITLSAKLLFDCVQGIIHMTGKQYSQWIKLTEKSNLHKNNQQSHICGFKAIKTFNGFIIPQIGFSVEYQKIKDDRHRVDIHMNGYEYNTEFICKEGALFFIEDITEGFKISEIIDASDKKYWPEIKSEPDE